MLIPIPVCTGVILAEAISTRSRVFSGNRWDHGHGQESHHWQGFGSTLFRNSIRSDRAVPSFHNPNPCCEPAKPPKGTSAWGISRVPQTIALTVAALKLPKVLKDTLLATWHIRQ